MNELLKKTPVSVSDLQAEWTNIRARRREEGEDEDEQEQEEIAESEAFQAKALSDSSLVSPTLRYSKKKPSLDFKPEDY
ncbi:unnamed protein product [Phytophthora fragariaefolia]|uniref:Unnamed protein product n=1 Tax=Phytophthora fragariaefolia TaxID=1490495 RepID=A0A9W6XSC9_9STRA|nr:unnamed protein product [Phytophthora fragariaefolia]